MTGSPDDKAVPAADPAAIAAAEQLLAAAKAMHDEALASLAAHKLRVDALLGTIGAQLQASIDKAKEDPGHVGYASGFLVDVELKGNEIVSWIQRHVGTAA